jgi:plastocyanin
MRMNAVFFAGAMLAALFGSASAQPAKSEQVREFYIKTVHIDGQTSTKGAMDHKAEAFPEDSSLPAGAGLQLSKPDADGNWHVRAFAFEPSQIVVNEGEPVRLNFVGVQGISHSIHLEGDGVDEKFTLKRGYLHAVDFTPTKPGVIEIECYDHQPSMKGEIVVLAH